MRDERTYEIPPETVQPILINGQQGIVAMGKYIGTPPERYGSAPELTIGTRIAHSPRAPQPMNEYMTWVYTQQSRVFFFARVPADDLPQLRQGETNHTHIEVRQEASTGIAVLGPG